jgi:hydrocephalus-inducing protein
VFLQQTVVTNDQPTSIDFGDIYINEKKVRTLTIDNKGDFNFDFSLRKHNSLSFIQLLPENGTVKKNEKFQINVVFQPIAPYKLNQGHNQIHLAIVSGPTYTFILNGNAKKPGVDFSFQSYDFGPCFVLKQPLPITKVLELRNRDTSAMAIETNFEKKPHFDV